METKRHKGMDELQLSCPRDSSALCAGYYVENGRVLLVAMEPLSDRILDCVEEGASVHLNDPSLRVHVFTERRMRL